MTDPRDRRDDDEIEYQDEADDDLHAWWAEFRPTLQSMTQAEKNTALLALPSDKFTALCMTALRRNTHRSKVAS